MGRELNFDKLLSSSLLSRLQLGESSAAAEQDAQLCKRRQWGSAMQKKASRCPICLL